MLCEFRAPHDVQQTTQIAQHRNTCRCHAAIQPPMLFEQQLSSSSPPLHAWPPTLPPSWPQLQTPASPLRGPEPSAACGPQRYWAWQGMSPSWAGSTLIGSLLPSNLPVSVTTPGYASPHMKNGEKEGRERLIAIAREDSTGVNSAGARGMAEKTIWGEIRKAAAPNIQVCVRGMES